MKLHFISSIKAGLSILMLVSLAACSQKKAPAAPSAAAADPTAAAADASTTKTADKSTTPTTTTTKPTTGAGAAGSAATGAAAAGAGATPVAAAADASAAASVAPNTLAPAAAAVVAPPKTPPNPAQQLVDKLDNQVKEKVASSPEIKKKEQFTNAFRDYLQTAKDLNDETWLDYEGASHAHLACSAFRLLGQYTIARTGFALSKPAVRLILRSGGAAFRASGAARFIPKALTRQPVLSEEGEVLHVELSKGALAAGKLLNSAGNLVRGVLKWVVIYDILNDPDNMEFVKAFVPEMQHESSNPIDQISQNAEDYQKMGLAAEDATMMSTMFKLDKAHADEDKQAFAKLQEIIKRNAEQNSEPVSLFENIRSGCTKESDRLQKVHSIYEAGQIKLEEYRAALADQ